MEKSETIKDIIYWAKRAYNAKMLPGTSGNISVLNKKEVLLSASGSCLGDLEEKDISKLTLDGVLKNKVKPSSEKLMHLEIYKKRPDIRAIIHIHCPYITSFAVCHKEINEPILPEFVFHFGAQAGVAIGDATSIDNKTLRGGVPSAKYHLPSSFELADEVSGYFKEGHNVVLMQNHGAVAGGKTLREVFYTLESIQAYTKTYFAAKFLGEIKSLSEEEIQQIYALKNGQ